INSDWSVDIRFGHQSSDLFVILNRCARILMTLRAKYGVWVTRKRNCFSETGTSSTSVIATAVALRGSLSIRAIPPNIVSRKIGHRSVPDLNANVTALDNEKLVRLVAFAENDIAGSYSAGLDIITGQEAKARIDRHCQLPHYGESDFATPS